MTRKNNIDYRCWREKTMRSSVNTTYRLITIVLSNKQSQRQQEKLLFKKLIKVT